MFKYMYIFILGLEFDVYYMFVTPKSVQVIHSFVIIILQKLLTWKSSSLCHIKISICNELILNPV